ncbi:hypothetical protein AB205_0163440 [Aquarana catesbeiana]|uniref:Uncharacterized protein n=1 Tax=Aquarana catesbeiana TaxID=8400 RepID=A0A2G9QG72_AQUCT|nr:hypothetical protein AB205_0163440 [Aquarana catesbeiana]
MMELLTGEVPIRCQDVTVCFSMEEWEYLEGHKDLYKDVMMENQQTWSDGKFRNAEAILDLTLEIIYLLTGEDCAVVMKTSLKDISKKKSPRLSKRTRERQNPITVSPPTFTNLERNSKKKILEVTNKITELLSGEVSSAENSGTLGLIHKVVSAALGAAVKYLYNDHNVRNTSEESSDKSHSRTLRSHSRNTLIDPSIPEESSSGQEGDHTEETSLSCSVCGKLFTNKRELLKHKKYHTVERPYSCSECGKCYTSKQNLRTHQYSHTGERPYSCSECGKYFTVKKNLIRHQKIHTGERSYSCSECRKCFFKKESLIAHQYSHTGERPFPCSECEKYFTEKKNLIRHQKIHTECGKSFMSKGGLVQHQRLHVGERHSCSECGKSFTTKGYLVQHQKIHTECGNSVIRILVIRSSKPGVFQLQPMEQVCLYLALGALFHSLTPMKGHNSSQSETPRE